MATLYDDVLDFLTAEGHIGGATGWTGYAGYMPTDAKIICVFETTGTPPEKKQDGSSETEYDELGFQIRGRGDVFGYTALREKMGQIYRTLHGSNLSPVTGTPAYLDVLATQSGPLPLGHDDLNRPELSWNFQCTRERETT